MKAAGVNPVDAYIASGNFHLKPPLPYIPGQDGSGFVEAIGSEVSKFKVCAVHINIVHLPLVDRAHFSD